MPDVSSPPYEPGLLSLACNCFRVLCPAPTHTGSSWSVCIFRFFKGMFMKALLSKEYTPRKLSRARSELFNTMRGSSSVPFALGIGKAAIQRELPAQNCVPLLGNSLQGLCFLWG